jgi:heme exporter protein D
MTGPRSAGVLLIVMAIGLLWNQVATDSSRWVIGAALALPFAVAGIGVLAGNRWGVFIGIAVAIVSLGFSGWLVGQANVGGASDFTTVLDFFGAGGNYSSFGVLFLAMAYVLLSLVVLVLLLVTLIRRRPIT